VLKTFRKGGIHPPENKFSARQPIRQLPAPPTVAILLSQHMGAPAKILVEKGSEVKTGQLIAQADYDQALFNYENSKASVSNARSALSRAKVNLDYATITSPIDGVVLNRAVEEGQTVAASFNTPTLFTIVNDLTQMEVQTSVDEADIGKVKKEQRVEFTVDAYPDMKFTGTVSQVRLQPVTTNNVVTYVVILSAQNPEKKLMPGMTASATIYVEERENSLVISGKALRFTPDKDYLAKMFEKSQPGGEGIFSGQKGYDPKVKTVWMKDEKMGIYPVIVRTGITTNSVKISIE